MLAGLFRVIETLFGVRIEPDTAPVWHPSVRFFRIERRAGECRVGQFYLDPMPAHQARRRLDGRRDQPARAGAGACRRRWRYLVCNFSAPVGGKPALLTHDEVHHAVPRIRPRPAPPADAGRRARRVRHPGVEWDAVELPSQFMENFCWEWDVLQHMTAHVDTGEPLPRALFDKMIAAKNFQSGMQTLRQVEFSLFDMRLHAESTRRQQTSATCSTRCAAEVAVLVPPACSRFRTPSRTSSPAAMRPATTATSGPRC